MSDTSDQPALAGAIGNLGLFWESVSGIANWDAADLQPVEATAPYATRYNATQLGYLDAALTPINAVDAPRVISRIPMQVSPATWIGKLRDQIQFLHDAAHMGDLVDESASHLDDSYPAVAALDEPLRRGTAQDIVDDYSNAGSAGALGAMENYLGQFWSVTTGQNHPLGIIYDFLRDNIPDSTAGLATISGDFLEYDAPSHALLLKQLERQTEESDGSFSYLRSEYWQVDANPAYSGGTAMKTSVVDNDVNILFAGSGIALIHSRWSQGATATWTIDGGTGGSGTVDMFPATAENQVETQLASGLDPTHHVLTLKKTAGTASSSILIDAISVQDIMEVPGNYNGDSVVDQRDLDLWTTTFGTSVPPGSGADGNGNGRIDGPDLLIWQRNAGSSASLDFTGPAVVLLVDARADGGVLGFDIDQGSVTGQVDLRAQNALAWGNWHRWPVLLSNSLPTGTHSLVLTALEANSGGRGAVNFDAIDVFEATGSLPSSTIAMLSPESTIVADDRNAEATVRSVSPDAVDFSWLAGNGQKRLPSRVRAVDWIMASELWRQPPLVFAGLRTSIGKRRQVAAWEPKGGNGRPRRVTEFDDVAALSNRGPLGNRLLDALSGEFASALSSMVSKITCTSSKNGR